MNNWKKYIPEGMRDILFDDCIKKVKIENELRNLYLISGFEQIISPTIEFYDVFNVSNQPIEQEKMYKLFDNQGRILVLRPDVTTPIARISATKLKDKALPLKLCYSSNIFRANEKWNGKMNEFTQSGVEIIGTESIKADAEIIITAINALKATGLKNFKIELGQAKIFKELAEDLKMSEEDIEKLRGLIENKSFAGISEFLSGNLELSKKECDILRELPGLFGGVEVLERARKLIDKKEALNALDSLQQVYEMLDTLGLSSYLEIDLGMVQNINYYTGIIFRGYSDVVGNNIVSGGRYDNLVESYGVSMPATGFAIDVDNVLLSLKRSGIKEETKGLSFLIHYENSFLRQANIAAEFVRENHSEAEISLFNHEGQALEFAKEKKRDYLLSYVVDDEVSVYKVKSEECCKYSIEEFNNFLAKLLGGN